MCKELSLICLFYIFTLKLLCKVIPSALSVPVVILHYIIKCSLKSHSNPPCIYKFP